MGLTIWRHAQGMIGVVIISLGSYVRDWGWIWFVGIGLMWIYYGVVDYEGREREQ